MRFKQRMLLVVSFWIITGFVLTASVSYYLSRQAALDSVIEHQLPLTSDNIFSEVQRDLLRPRIVSSFMANDTFLQDWLINGEQDVTAVTRYLNEIKHKYQAFTAFVVSEKSRNYYHAEGYWKQVSEQEPNDSWYFRVRAMPEESELNLDPDLAHEGVWTIFINFKLYSATGEFLGATGLGLNLEHIKQVLSDYRHKYGNHVFFLTKEGQVLLQDQLGTLQGDIKAIPGLATIADAILKEKEGRFRYQREGQNYHLNTRYIEELGLVLCVEMEEARVEQPLLTPLLVNLIVCFFVTLIVLWLLFRTLSRYQAELESIAWQDPLTGVLNRRAFVERYQEVASGHERKQLSMSLLMLDVDHFKQINDSYGHDLGDEVLKLLTQELQLQLRPSDLLGRWGGEEFILLLPETSLEQAQAIAERMRETIEHARSLRALAKEGVSLSIGVAEQRSPFNMDRHIKSADLALYTAKQEGRNRVELA